MQKRIIIVALYLCFSSIAFSADFYPSKYEGTYIPVRFMEVLKSSGSYYQSIKQTKKSSFYDILCLRNNEIYSNLKFHDASLVSKIIKTVYPRLCRGTEKV